MLDTVCVDPKTFRSLIFMGSSERRQFTADRRPTADKPQKRTAEGQPLWSLRLAAVSWRNTPTMLTVTVPAYDDPAKTFVVGEPVELSGLVFGVTARREGGYVTWCSADGIEAQVVRKRAIA